MLFGFLHGKRAKAGATPLVVDLDLIQEELMNQ